MHHEVCMPLPCGRGSAKWQFSRGFEAIRWGRTKLGFKILLPKFSKYLVRRCLDPLKAEPQEAFGKPNTRVYSPKVE